MADKIRTYRDLIVWQKARELVLETYKQTKHFPKDEQFALISQMRRAATSVTANIAEGFGRFARKDREHFYVMASGSLFELDSHFQISFDLKYVTPTEHEQVTDLLNQTSKLLHALLRAHRRLPDSRL